MRKYHVITKDCKVNDPPICDICGEEMKTVLFDGSRIDIEAKIGMHYPEGDFRNCYRLDVCPDCFLTRVKPCLEEHLHVHFHEYDADDDDGYYQN